VSGPIYYRGNHLVEVPTRGHWGSLETFKGGVGPLKGHLETLPKYLCPMAQEVSIGPMATKLVVPKGSWKPLVKREAYTNLILTGSYRAQTSPQERWAGAL
jgi:hypothetical protein